MTTVAVCTVFDITGVQQGSSCPDTDGGQCYLELKGTDNVRVRVGGG